MDAFVKGETEEYRKLTKSTKEDSNSPVICSTSIVTIYFCSFFIFSELLTLYFADYRTIRDALISIEGLEETE